MNIYSYLRYILPNVFFNGGYLEKLTTSITFPFDIQLQIFDQIPKLRDPYLLADKDLKYLSYEKGMKRYYNEPDYRARLKKSFDYWVESGSRAQINAVLTDIGFVLDDNVPGGYDDGYWGYGIADGYTAQSVLNTTLAGDGYAIWSGDYSRDGISYDGYADTYWDHFVWGEEVQVWAAYGIFISDPLDTLYNGEQWKLYFPSIIEICQTYSPANTILTSIFLTDGNGIIKHSFSIDKKSNITMES